MALVVAVVGLALLAVHASHSIYFVRLGSPTLVVRVISHKMTNEKTQQIIGRGQRPGRVGVLNIWKLYYHVIIVTLVLLTL